MDPACQDKYALRNRFPRTRGDGPIEAVWKEAIKRFPPHTRGWTPRPLDQLRWPDVSPAHAGMDHEISITKRATIGFPRTRGDGPCRLRAGTGVRRFPPHTRGWTLVERGAELAHQVSPAHAGMDPRAPSDRVGSCRFPRTRGDGPCPVSPVTVDPRFPPHTRGWTRLSPNARSVLRVSPAHAGMDPPASDSYHIPVRFPRTRGDGPFDRETLTMRNRFPPHTRGWTGIWRQQLNHVQVSPAHAGMDRLIVHQACFPHCFPRTRGDGPGSDCKSPLPAVFPPHTRGWTVG